MNSLQYVLDWFLPKVEHGKVYHMIYEGRESITLTEVPYNDYIPSWFSQHVKNKSGNSI